VLLLPSTAENALHLGFYVHAGFLGIDFCFLCRIWVRLERREVRWFSKGLTSGGAFLGCRPVFGIQNKKRKEQNSTKQKAYNVIKSQKRKFLIKISMKT